MARHRRAFAFSARVSQVGVSSKAELEMRALGRVRLAPTVTRGATLALAAALLVPPLAAQLPAADEAFRKGDYAAARAGYERVLTTDSLNARALYRLAILDSWDGKLRSEEHTSELQSRLHLVCRLLLEKKKKNTSSP